MATGFPVKANYATGDVLTATNMNDLSGTVNYLQYMPPRNPVLNSAMNVWQRGTSISVAASTSAYTADRWYASMTANAASTISRQVTGDTTNLPNIQYCLRLQRNSGQTGTTGQYLYQSFESVNSIPFAGKSVTVSFYARAGATYISSGATSTFKLWSGTGTDQNVVLAYTGQSLVTSTAPTLTATWQRFTMTGTVPATMTELAVGVDMGAVGTAGATDYIEITGVQLELGSVANTYMPNQPTYQGELAACQRYYWRTGGLATYQIMGYGVADGTTTCEIMIPNPVTMRVNPTSVDYSTLNIHQGGTNVAVSSLTISSNNLGNNPTWVYATVAAGLTQYRPYFLTANNSTSAYLGFSAEL